VWRNLAPTKEEAFFFMKEKILEMLDWQDGLRKDGTFS
jgi:hypothetical protein